MNNTLHEVNTSIIKNSMKSMKCLSYKESEKTKLPAMFLKKIRFADWRQIVGMCVTNDDGFTQ